MLLNKKQARALNLLLEKESKYRNNFSYTMPTQKSDFNSAKFFQNFLSRLAGSRALPSEDITAIIWNFPAENSQISLRETSDNRDVIRHLGLGSQLQCKFQITFRFSLF
jgi:hypothetical protein